MTNSARGTLDIETAGDEVILDAEEDHVLDVIVRGDAAASYSLDVSDRPSQFITDSETWTGVTEIDTGFYNSTRFVRLRVTAGTGTAGETATVLLASSGGD